MATLIGPDALRKIWAKKISKRDANSIALMEQNVAHAKGNLEHWSMEGHETLIMHGDAAARAIPMKDGLVLAFGDADPKGAKWKKRTGIMFPVEGPVALFSTKAPADGAPVELAKGEYNVVFDAGLVRLKLRK